jgi:hypothetical protein
VLDSEEVGRGVKGRDERPAGALDAPPDLSRRSCRTSIGPISPGPGGHASFKKSLCELCIAKFFGQERGAPLCSTHYKRAPRPQRRSWGVGLNKGTRTMGSGARSASEQSSRNEKSAAKERSSTALRSASFPHSIVEGAGGVSRVEINALRAPLTPLPPPSKAERQSQVVATRKPGRSFVVPCERFAISLERSAHGE